MTRIWQIVLILSAVCFSWLAMMAVHEFGHVLQTWATGGSVRRVELPLIGFSRTDVAENPSPRLVAWGGGIWGVLLPLSAYLITIAVAPRFGFLAAFFAGFCLIANGAYLGGGAFLGDGDAADLLRHGAEKWQLASFGVITIASGLRMWHGLGPNFGLRQTGGHVDRPAAIIALCALAVIVIVDLIVQNR